MKSIYSKASRLVTNIKSNGKSHNTLRSPLTFNEQTSLSRLAIARKAGLLDEIDVERECRYIVNPTIRDYQHLYDRVGIASRVVGVYPEESWAMLPEIYETESVSSETDMEAKWKGLSNRLNILTHIQTADELSRIGSFGILFMGFNDNRNPREPVAGINERGQRDGRFSERELLYVRPFSQYFCNVTKLQTDTSNPRYGLPVEYNILFNSTNTQGGLGTSVQETQSFNVHWSRVIHIAENKIGGKTSSLLYSTPAQQPVLNDITNIMKVLGADAQGFWQFGFPGLSIETQAGVDDPDFDVEETKKQIENYLEGLQRYIALNGLTAKAISPEAGDPSKHFQVHMSHISITTGVPMRIMLGTEEAKLASSQDMRTWNKRLSKRQETHLTPFLLRPFFERLFLVGALPRPKSLTIKWPDLNAPTEQDRANTSAKITDALMKYVAGNIFLIMPPKEYLTIVMGFPVPQVEAILKSAGVKKMMALLNKMAQASIQKGQPGQTPRKGKKPGVDAGAGPSR